jgi:hypothetical protein
MPLSQLPQRELVQLGADALVLISWMDGEELNLPGLVLGAGSSSPPVIVPHGWISPKRLQASKERRLAPALTQDESAVESGPPRTD